ncbi:PREDICTED: telomere-associated protein RIF1-like [Dufourea novaeangliae]|uniref:telomere-associated protein RIF1-like n=1 Tax=Dufourea novaeangliae TaxID=178035 RepID=UPI00076749D1|nr:PREDICTED: telomere-associated protein RIF1-like [Dufourea novaeangliae]
MASNIQSFPRMLKMLRENSNIKDKHEALTYIRSNSKKLETTKAIKEEQYKELCKLVIDAFANGNIDIQNEAYETLNVIIQDFRDHSLNLFETMWQISHKNRLKILKLLEVVEDNAISTVAYDTHTVNFFNNCMCTIKTNTMPWIAPTACIDNIQALIKAENKPLSDDQRLEEETINYCMILLRRLYKVAGITSDSKVERFNALLLDKIMLLAYMGHKRQRGPALKLLQQALATDVTSHIRTKLSDAWAEYKAALQSMYCKRMLLLVSACELDWTTQWNISIQFLGVDLHRGAGLINNLLSVEEKAFKSIDTVIRRQAFLSWKLLVDNFALDPQELATARRIKLLCIPLNAKNSKNELIALTKLEVWWHVIVKLYKDICKFVNPVITQFLNFCFGPLGDTPLLSSKFEIVASPGKRFYKTKIIAVDALCQLLVTKQENNAVFSPILEERLPHSMSNSVFQECYTSVIHSVGEALLVLSQLTDAEMKNRYQLGKILWSSLVNYVQESKAETKELVYKDLILVITELTNYAADKPMIRNLILDTIIFDITKLNQHFNFEDNILLGLVLRFLQVPLLTDANKIHYEILKSLFFQCIKSEIKDAYYSDAFKYLKDIYEKLSTLLSAEQKNESIIFELWLILAEVLIQYMKDLQDINEGNATEHNLKTVESIVIFPFMYMSLEDHEQVEELMKVWKLLYKQFEMRADLIKTVKTNQILLSVANAMQCCIVKNEKSCCLITKSLDTLLSTINYTFLLANIEVPSIIQLIVQLITCSLSNKNTTDCESALKALSAVLITIYGHNPQKVVSYLQVCKPAIELILLSSMDTIYKEVSSTWETVVNILKGLNKLVDYVLILSYKKAIILALNHTNLDIQSQAISLFDITNMLSGNAKSVLQEIEMEAHKDKVSDRSDAIKENDHIGKLQAQVKRVGSFLNKRSVSPKRVVKETDKSNKNLLSNSDSEDYVFIKTDVKFDVSRLTEHQKESLKRRRDDIPALYNDLSQSSSQDTQNLQEWFDRKNKALEETEKTHTKKDNISMKNVLNHDANKENKIEIKESEIIDKATIQSDTKLVDHVGQNVTVEFVQNIKGDIENHENFTMKDVKVVEAESSSNCIADNTNLASQIENKDNGQRLSPSILDNGKRRNRSSTIIRSSNSSNLEEINNQPEQSTSTRAVERKLRTKVIQHKSKMLNKQGLPSNVHTKSFDMEKRGIKRKSTSDSESESTTQRRRRKTMPSETATDSDSSKSTESDNIAMYMEGLIDDGNLSQRTRNEISRLRINMIFDSPLPNSRRSKGHDDHIKEGVAKKQSPESKGTKPKFIDIKTGDSLRKTQRNTNKDLIKTQHVSRRGRPKVYSSTLKLGLTVDRHHDVTESENTKKTLQTKTNEAEEEQKLEEENQAGNNIRTDVSRTGVTDIECDKNGECNSEVGNKDLDSDGNIETTQDAKSVEQLTQTRDDTQDIIENSQELSELQKKCNEKQCFIKINKIGELCNSMKFQDVMVEDEEIADTASNSCDNDHNEVSKDDAKESEKISEVDTNKPKILTPTAENNSCDNVEVPKINEGSLMKSVIGFLSPKSNTKRLKFKSYSAQGRAAHMLGLVTKQARMETEGNIINIDDEAATKKVKLKDVESETVFGKKERGSTFKEADKVTATCSSRQEKIFNNMRSSDYCSSPPIKLFSNLKNDGEKFVSKVDKSVDSVSIQTDIQSEKVMEETSIEMDELPILEWSSANPPSLTASPSCSILKRQRQSPPVIEPECTTPKRKRVSFADPPVSMEMGYETGTSDSPHRVNKLTSRGLLGRKDSPLRMKQFKQRLIHIEIGKMECDEEIDTTNTSEVDLQCVRENELLTKIADELEYSENIAIDADNTQIPSSSAENDSTDLITAEEDARNKIKMDNLSVELEITQNTRFSKHLEEPCENKEVSTTDIARKPIPETSNTKSVNTNTDEDIFNVIGTKNGIVNDIETNNNTNTNDEHNISVENNSVEFSTTNDSITRHLFKSSINSENLEDTVDAGNLSGLNSTANSDEIFCGKFMRTSTQGVDSAEEQDTLPVTDSVFGSLPLSQDSQNTSEFDIEIPHPELLDSTLPLYPSLISCSEPVQCIIDKLTYPPWVQYLSTYFASRKLETVGDLARLSEREINRIPVKGNSKIECVKSVLKCFEKTHVTTETNDVTEYLNNAVNSKALISVNMDVSASETISQDQLSKKSSETIPNEDTSHTTDDVDITENKTTETSKNAAQFGLDETSNLPALDSSPTFPRTEATIASSAPVSVSESLNTIQTLNEPVSSTLDVVTSEVDVGCSHASKTRAVSVLNASKTVASCTNRDSIYLPKPTVRKSTKSVEAQMALEDLLDEIDVNLVLESAVRRCTPEKILLQYKNKMRHVPQLELERETIRMLGSENRKNCNETTLKTACRACGINKVLLRLPDIFSAEKQFFVKVLNAYRQKIKTSDCLNILDFTEVKDTVCQKCTSSELAEMLSEKLKEEEQKGIKKPMTELSSLDAMLKRMPMDAIISHTVANDELIPSRVVLDIALQNNNPSDIAQALESQSAVVTKNIFDKLWSSQFAVEHIDRSNKSKEDLFKIFKAVSSKLSQQELLEAFYENMNAKITATEEKQ